MASQPQAYDPFAQDPSGAYPALRAAARPVHRYEGRGFRFFALSRHADIRAVLSQPALFSMRFGQMHTDIPGQGLTIDPPEHTAIRRFLNPLFMPQKVGLLAQKIEDTAAALINGIARAGACDFYRDIAAPFAVHVAAEMLAVDPKHQAGLKQWTLDFTQGLNSGDVALETGAREKVYAYFSDVLADRRVALARGDEVPDDVITALVQGQHLDGRPLDEAIEVLPSLLLLLTGGIDTTSFLMTNCLYRLLEDPARWRRVCEEPGLAAVAVEESLRFNSPVFATFRTNEEDVVLHDVYIPKFSKIQLLYASANRDPAVFEDPDRFSLDRDLAELRRNHLALGGGIHACIGNALARLSVRLGITVLAAKLPSLRLAGPPTRYKGCEGAIAVNNGFVALPVRW